MGNLTRGGWVYVCAFGLGLGLAACNAGKSCKKPGSQRACACDAARGSQRCLPERVWSACECTGPSPDAAAGRDAAASAAGATEGGAAPASMSGTKSDAASVAPPAAAADSGTHVPNDAGHERGGTGGGGAGAGGSHAGASGRSVDSGAGGAAAGGAGAGGSSASAYAACTDASDCSPAGSSCELVPADATLGTPGGSACAPPCASVADCPAPAGSYTATVSCEADSFCRLDCTDTEGNLPPVPRSCPSGMHCVTADLVASHCLR